MNIGIWAWYFFCIMLLASVFIAWRSRRLMHSTADFLAANRVAGRYVLNLASGFLAIVTIMSSWEMNYATGLSPQWWGRIAAPIGLFIMLTGFVVYRYRQTRAMTVPQFFEMRYSRNFRLFAGFLCWLSGLLNYGIFPAITAKFLINFLQLPAAITVCAIEIQMYPALMILYLSVAVFISCCGGMISIMASSIFQNTFASIVLCGVLVFLACSFSWSDIFAGLQIAPHAGSSMVDPFQASTTTEFNLTYFLIGVFMAMYGVMAWQGASGYGAAAKTPHEAVVSNVINSWRYNAYTMLMLFIPLLVYSIMHLDKFADIAAPIQASVSALPVDVQRQMVVPIGLSHLLPGWMSVLFVMAVFYGTITCDSVYTHSWGTILVQDVIAPLRGKPLSPKTHILIMRLAIIGVAVFGFVFSMLFPLKDYIAMFFSLTAAIYVGGVGAVMIGGLYWKHGTTAGAWTAMTIGTIGGLGGMAVQQVWPFWIKNVFYPGDNNSYKVTIIVMASFAAVFMVLAVLSWFAERFRAAAMRFLILGIFTVLLGGAFAVLMPRLQVMAADSPAAWNWFETSEYATRFFDGQRIMFIAALAAVLGYVGVSLLGKRNVHNMDKLLHRGKYAVADDGAEYNEPKKEKLTFNKFIGIGPGFTRSEKFLFGASFFWNIGWWGSFLLGCAVSSLYTLSERFWYWYWAVLIYSSLIIGVLFTILVLYKSIGDGRDCLQTLRRAKTDERDDGFIR